MNVMAEAPEKYRIIVRHDDHQWQVVTGFGHELKIIKAFPGVDTAAQERADKHCDYLNQTR